MTMADKSANPSALDISDDELSQLLSQAKKDLTCLETEKKKKKEKDSTSKNKGRERSIPSLSVPLRLDDGNMSEDSRLISIDSETGMARIDVDNMYKTTSNLSQKSSITAEIEGKNAHPDPTIKRMTAGEALKQREKTAGKNWFGIKAPTMTPEIKNDLRVLQLRNVLDPKRFYKKSSSKELPKYFEIGTIIEGPTEFYSSRLTKKQRQNNLVDELLADKQSRDYFKRKVGEIHARNYSGGKAWYQKATGGNAKNKYKGVQKHSHQFKRK
ncbi:Fcf2-domain-containing protein [Coemansia reversa NRRL 1564]|uniref:Fcf2-domain-containing protein n=1 Tax=Coemansia reversa (strain ATCC 12441 / NRRL 1564) TaxID=763665 RepID=A0A2G5B8W8_COERN|nr:Fcf2-domain-containing protein [Coemansia reversa NRRL 1564]|eukprot:PIA15459.1 Fcf2-domain-containing protein [Coemansia reversa NRRL 1564]